MCAERMDKKGLPRKRLMFEVRIPTEQVSTLSLDPGKSHDRTKEGVMGGGEGEREGEGEGKGISHLQTTYTC